MSNKSKQKIDMKSIKEYEKAQRSLVKNETPNNQEIPFDQWWADRSAILKQPPHMKEIIHADFKGRGLTAKHAVEKWDWAAKQFGLNI
jgi:hypothetical protein